MRFATLTDHLGPDKQTGIDRAVELGFDGIELVIPDGVHDIGSHGMALNPDHPPTEADPIWRADDRAALRERARSRGLALPSLCPSFMNMRPGLVDPAAEERAHAREQLIDLIAAAGDFGATTILVPFFMDAEITDADATERVVDELQQLAPRAADAGVTLAIETTLDADANRAIIEAVDHPAVAIYYDVCNVLLYGYDPAEEIRALGDHIEQVHFKDMSEDGGHAQLGAGQVAFDEVADALQEIGYDDWIVLETSYVDDPVGTMGENLQFARELLDELP